MPLQLSHPQRFVLFLNSINAQKVSKYLQKIDSNQFFRFERKGCVRVMYVMLRKKPLFGFSDRNPVVTSFASLVFPTTSIIATAVTSWESPTAWGFPCSVCEFGFSDRTFVRCSVGVRISYRFCDCLVFPTAFCGRSFRSVFRIWRWLVSVGFSYLTVSSCEFFFYGFVHFTSNFVWKFHCFSLTLPRNDLKSIIPI